MHVPRVPLFRIWYSTTYTGLFIILVLLLAVTPADTIYQSIKGKELEKLFTIGGVYLLTFIIMLLIYSTRIYTNRTVLQAIPKGYIPIEQGEVGKMVRRMVARHLHRSAIIAWDSRPRDVRRETGTIDSGRDGDSSDIEQNVNDIRCEKPEEAKTQKKRLWHHTQDPSTIIRVNPKSPPWGHVSHPGWASPSSPDLPNLQYWTVICELPNLIEAKAVSLAPPDPAINDVFQQYPDNAPPLPDAQIVTLLQRPRAMGLREYLSRLASLGLLNDPPLIPTFLAQYEHARFSTSNLTEPEFRTLMSTFASILSSMTELDPQTIEDLRITAAQAFSDADTHSLAPTQLSSLSSERTSRSASSRSNLPFRTPQMQRQRSVDSYTGSSSETASFSSADEMRGGTGTGTHSPQTVRTAASRRSRSMPGANSSRRASRDSSLLSGSETGSVVVHTPLGQWGGEGDGQSAAVGSERERGVS